MGKLKRIQSAYTYLIVTFIVIFGVLLYSQTCHITVVEYAATMENNNYFVSTYDGRVYTIKKEVDLNTVVVERVIVETSERRQPFVVVTKWDYSDKMRIIKCALTEFVATDVFVRKDGSTWISQQKGDSYINGGVLVRYNLDE